MNRIRIVGLALVVATAVAAVAATSASAMGPEWGRCLKVPVEIKGKVHKTGKFSNANCTEAKTGGAYEFVKGAEGLPGGTSFTAKQTSEKAELETSQGISVDCTGTEATGAVSGTKEVADVEVKFTGCELPLLNFACEGNFHENEAETKFEFVEGEIITRVLKGKLGYVSGKGTAEPKVGLELEPEEKGGLFAEFECGLKDTTEGGPLIVRVGAKEAKGSGNSIISPISPVNTMGTTLTQTYTEKTITNEAGEVEREKGIQEPQSFEGGKRDALESEASDALGSLGWAKAGQVETLETKLNSGEELEIKA
jgi:hypothetical protein